MSFKSQFTFHSDKFVEKFSISDISKHVLINTISLEQEEFNSGTICRQRYLSFQSLRTVSRTFRF